MAGWPVTLKIAVYGVNSPRARKSSHGSSLHASISPIRTGRCRERRAQDHVVVSQSAMIPRDTALSWVRASR